MRHTAADALELPLMKADGKPDKDWLVKKVESRMVINCNFSSLFDKDPLRKLLTEECTYQQKRTGMSDKTKDIFLDRMDRKFYNLHGGKYPYYGFWPELIVPDLWLCVWAGMLEAHLKDNHKEAVETIWNIYSKGYGYMGTICHKVCVFENI